ncbi:FAD-dependent oxidoreductase [Fodinicola acaciae]|uniref:FAD-dependent oxidoreductase n=1 Tax=Fodinicola acaciae TaxID=2681555 RepID=UPI0013D73370|nr:NAD(P)/FAD-dependent oxidoreductase [Fodinicola acaciae]
MSALRNAPRVLVIGAGTGGLALAHGLRRAGIPVTVFERDRTRTDGLQGYRVGISPDGSRALHDLLPPELFDIFVATCARAPIYFNQYTENWGELLSMGPEVADSAPAPGDIAQDRSVSRMTLRQVLLTGLEDVVRFDKVFQRYEQNADGTVTACFEDGTSATGDVLVAADGSNSRVRQQYLPHARMFDTGLVGITGKTELNDRTRALLPEKVQRGVSMVFAPGGNSMIVHVMQFNWDLHGKPRDDIGGSDADLLASWPGLQWDNTRDYVMIGFGTAARTLPTNVMDLRGQQLKNLLIERTRRWHPHLRELLSLVDPGSCFPLNIRTTERQPQWPTSNVTLIGDAIHTMTPGRGVGANTALRDARLLCRKLVAVRDGQLSLLDGIRAYETKMIDYAFDAVEKSLSGMTVNQPIFKPFIGPLALAGMRTSMRVINNVPALKRKMARSFASIRDQDDD